MRELIAPRSIIDIDPRRPGRPMLSVWCFCGRFYTVTPEAFKVRAAQHTAGEHVALCPNPTCQTAAA